MKKKIINESILLLFLIIYLLLGSKLHIFIPCYIHELTGLYCPGCGITRMLLSLLKLDFVAAFRYNPLLFILLPFGIFLFIENYYSLYKNKKPLYQKIDNKVWIVLIVILIIYGILRNIFPVLAPTEIQ